MLFNKEKKTATRTAARQAGFTAVEVLVVVVIMTILSALIMTGFNALNKRQALDKDRMLVISVLNDARSRTLSSIEASKYGVHFEDEEIIFFQGNTYSQADADNQHLSLSTYTEITDIDLSGSGDDIIFERLTGRTLQPGTITLSLKSDASSTKVITIEGTGVINSN